MPTSAPCPAARPTYESRLVARLAEMLAATDRFVSWWRAHRAWPADTPEWDGRR